MSDPKKVTVPIGEDGDTVEMLSYFDMPIGMIIASQGDGLATFGLARLAIGEKADETLEILNLREAIALVENWTTKSAEREAKDAEERAASTPDTEDGTEGPNGGKPKRKRRGLFG